MTGEKSQVIIVIPALNEADSITQVVHDVASRYDVLVIDDGSSDGTDKKAREAGAEVIVHSNNLGYDKAIETGLRWASEHTYTYAIILDADGQHRPEDIPRFYECLKNGAEIVVGSRSIKGRFSEVLFGIVSYFAWGISDPLCGMKGYRIDLLRSLGGYCTYESIGTEITIRSLIKRKHVQEVDILISDRSSGNSRFGWSANAKIVSALVKGLAIASRELMKNSG